ncbi:MAG: hypothetical protein KGL11_04530 [Alphaproteobacteria bacterium]|nr:hypothetical protein [Alphaproteobacteria bacterium]
MIKKVDIERPQVTYELDNGGSSNLATLQKNAMAYGGGGAAPANGSERKLIIDDLVIRQGQVGISQAMLKGKSLSAPLPEIHLTNIGKSSGGASPAEVAKEVLAAITGAAAKIGSSEVAKSIGSAVSGTSQGVGSQLKSLLGK